MGWFVETKGGGCKCKTILHIVAPSGPGLQSLNTICNSVCQMLQFLENRGYKWIALPPIGTGINGVPVSDFVSGLI